MLFLVLALLTAKTLSALGKYLGWLSIKDHEYTDPVMRRLSGDLPAPPYLSRLVFWLTLWFMTAAAIRALGLP